MRNCHVVLGPRHKSEDRACVALRKGHLRPKYVSRLELRLHEKTIVGSRGRKAVKVPPPRHPIGRFNCPTLNFGSSDSFYSVAVFIGPAAFKSPLQTNDRCKRSYSYKLDTAAPYARRTWHLRRLHRSANMACPDSGMCDAHFDGFNPLLPLSPFSSRVRKGGPCPRRLRPSDWKRSGLLAAG